MKLNKIFLIVVMAVLMSFTAFAFDYNPNESIRIDAEYRVIGILSSADANLTIEDPDGTIVLDNQNMTEVSTGVFYYDFLIPQNTGDYFATVRFYNKSSDTLLGSSTRTFEVGFNPLQFGVCSNDKSSLQFLWGILIFCFVLMFVDYFVKVKLLGMIGAFGTLMTSLYFYPCSNLFGALVLALSLLALGYFIFNRD